MEITIIILLLLLITLLVIIKKKNKSKSSGLSNPIHDYIQAISFEDVLNIFKSGEVIKTWDFPKAYHLISPNMGISFEKIKKGNILLIGENQFYRKYLILLVEKLKNAPITVYKFQYKYIGDGKPKTIKIEL